MSEDAVAGAAWFVQRARRRRGSDEPFAASAPEVDISDDEEPPMDGGTRSCPEVVDLESDLPNASPVPGGVNVPRGPAMRARFQSLARGLFRRGPQTPTTAQISLEEAGEQFRSDFEDQATGEVEDETRVLRSHAHLWGLDMRLRYNRRGTRGRGLRLLGGEVIEHSSLDEYCYARALEPGFVFSERNKQLLFVAAVAHAEHYGYSVTTASGTCSFKAGNRNALMGILARRAAEGVLFRDSVEELNRETNGARLADDWRAHWIHSRNIVDVGLAERVRSSARRKFERWFALAQARPPRQ